MDWQAWTEAFEDGSTERFVALFAECGEFSDPVTAWTTDVRKVGTDTHEHFPDWHAHVDELRTGDGWAVAQWTGTGTFGGVPGRPVAVTIHGASVIEVDGDGKVTRWRDYLDTAESMDQIKAALSP
jgi:steroid delta-isomerase-like uncharacterized protein